MSDAATYYRRSTPVIVNTGEWKNSCQSILVSAEECRKPKYATNNLSKLKADLDSAAKSFSKNFPLSSLLSPQVHKKRTKQSAEDNINKNKRQVRWSTQVDQSLKKPPSSVTGPRRLNLQEKVELFFDRPDLDLLGIMARLEAIKRLEMASMAKMRGSGSFNPVAGSGGVLNQFFAYRNNQQDNEVEETKEEKDEINAIDYEMEVESKDDDVDMVDVNEDDDADNNNNNNNNTKRTCTEEDRFYDAYSKSVESKMSPAVDGAVDEERDDSASFSSSSTSSSSSLVVKERVKSFSPSLVARPPVNSDYHRYWLQNRR